MRMGYEKILKFGVTLMFLLVNMRSAGAQSQEPTTREAVVEQDQAEKSQNLHAYTPTRAERWMAEAQEALTATERNWHPYFESAYPGGGFPFGSGFARYVSPFNKVDLRGSYTTLGYARVEAEFLAPRIFHRRGLAGRQFYCEIKVQSPARLRGASMRAKGRVAKFPQARPHD